MLFHMRNFRNLDPKLKLGGRVRLFVPILSGATLRERLVACVGTLIVICLTGSICGINFGSGPYLPVIIAPIGASAVLLFAIPTSPLAQPWPIIGGNSISAFVGVAVAHWIHDPIIASGMSVSLAIAAMSLTRSLHPPGGAAALSAVLGGPLVTAAGFTFPLAPVALNSIILVTLGFCFHKVTRRSYPHVSASVPANNHQTIDPLPQLRAGVLAQDVDAALKVLGETFDISHDDLDLLVRQAEFQALFRLQGTLLCKDIFSKDVVSIVQGTNSEDACDLLLYHNIRVLPVVDANGRLIGIVGLRELLLADESIDSVISQAVTASASDPAVNLIPFLTDGKAHAAVIVDENRHILGIVTQTDLLASLARLLLLGQQAIDDTNR